MALAERELEIPERRKGPMCRMGVILEELDADDIATLQGWLAGDMTGYRIASILTADGHPVKQHTVQYHRTGKCSCDTRG